jgi:hypothetical protein
MKRIFQALVTSAAFVVLALGIAMPIHAATCDPGGGITAGITCSTPDQQAASKDLGANIRIITNTLVVVVIVAAVIMVIIGGLRYTLSGGNSSATKEAKDQILYAVIGIIVALIAGGIINFVVSKFVK